MKLNEEEKIDLKNFINDIRQIADQEITYVCVDTAKQCYNLISETIKNLLEDKKFNNHPMEFLNSILSICAMISGHHIHRLIESGFADEEKLIKEFFVKLKNSIHFQRIAENNPGIFKDH